MFASRHLINLLDRILSTGNKHLQSPVGKKHGKLAILSLVLLAVCFSAVQAGANCDLVEDNYIGCSDLAAFATKWLTDCSVNDCGGADLYNDNTVDFADLALFGQAWRTVPQPGLIGWWKFDEGSGSVAGDSSGNGHDGTITGALWSSGIIGNSLDFHGAGRYVTVEADALSPLANGSYVTVALWLYGDSDLPQGTTAFQATYSSSGDTRVIGAQIPWYGTVYWDTIYAGSWDRLSKAAEPSECRGQWNHWAFTKDAVAGEMKIYLNGSLWAIATGKRNPLAKAVFFKIGSNINGQENYGGRIDDFRVYDVALGDNEVNNIYIGVFNKAGTPYPRDGEGVWDSQVVLNWQPAPYATQHDVCLGTNFADVDSANITIYDPNGVYKRRQTANSYNTATNDPCGLEPGTTYYWRIDEVIGSNRYKGDVWSFVFRPEDDFEGWGTDILRQIDKDLKKPIGYLYTEYATAGGTQSQTAYLWPQGIQFHALNNAADLNPTTYLNKVKSFAAELHSGYWSYKNAIGGYDSSITGGTRFYDDNAWIVLGYMRLYELSGGSSLYLNRAKNTMAFVMSGENPAPQSGIAWDEGSRGTTVCSTAPAVVGNLLLYKATGTQQYLDDALRLYNWVTNPDIGIQDAETGLFHQGCNEHLEVNWGYRGYQTAVPLRACLLFYEILGDERYLTEAKRLAKSMEDQWVDAEGAFAETGQWGGFDMVEAYVDLYNVDSDSHWLNIVRRALHFVHADCRDRYGRYPEYWNTLQATPIQKFYLLYQAPVATAYWKAASVMD